MINLKQLYSKRYKIFMDESWAFCKSRNNEDEIAFHEIQGRYGKIYPFDDIRLAVMLTSSTIKERVKRDFRIQITTLWDGDGEGVFLFNPELIHEIARVIRVRRKRQLSPEQRQKLVEAGQKYQFKHGAKGEIRAQI